MSSMPPTDKDNEPQSIKVKELVLALALACTWLAVQLVPLRGLPLTAEDAPGYDAHIYLAMAESPFVFTSPPHGYRIGVPFLAHFLPLETEPSFFSLTVLGLLGTLTLAYVFLRRLGFSHGMGLLGLSFVGAAPEIAGFLQNYFLVDPLSICLIVALFIAIERDSSAGVTALLLLVASLFKESAFYVLPVLYFRRAGGWRWSGRAAWKVFWICLPAVAAALILRFAWGGELSGFPYRLPWSIPRQPWIGSLDAYIRIWRGLFGYLSLIAIANAFTNRWRDFALGYVSYFVIVVAQLIVPLNSERLLFYSFPFIVPLALAEFQRIKDTLPDWFPLLCTLLVLCYLFTPTQLLVPLGLIIMARLLAERRRHREAGS
jgi:hypothetical protein